MWSHDYSWRCLVDGKWWSPLKKSWRRSWSWALKTRGVTHGTMDHWAGRCSTSLPFSIHFKHDWVFLVHILACSSCVKQCLELSVYCASHEKPALCCCWISFTLLSQYVRWEPLSYITNFQSFPPMSFKKGIPPAVMYWWITVPLWCLQAAETLLESEGDFLVRDSRSAPGDYVLSCFGKNGPFHFKIIRVVLRPKKVSCV